MPTDSKAGGKMEHEIATYRQLKDALICAGFEDLDALLAAHAQVKRDLAAAKEAINGLVAECSWRGGGRCRCDDLCAIRTYCREGASDDAMQ